MAPRFALLLLLGSGSLLAGPMSAQAHPGADERAHHVSGELAHHPHDPQLYLRRGELHVEDGDFEAAARDFDEAERLAPKLPELGLYRGLMWLEAEQPARALSALERYLALVPEDAKAMRMRADALARLGYGAAAAAAYGDLLAVEDRPGPEPFLRRAALLEADARVDEARKTLEDGIARVGPNIALVEHAVDLEARHGTPKAALERLANLPSKVQDSPRWLARRGKLLADDGRLGEAFAAYCRGLWKIGSLPSSRRNVPALARLHGELVASIRQLL